MVTSLNASTNRYQLIYIPCAIWLHLSREEAENLREVADMFREKEHMSAKVKREHTAKYNPFKNTVFYVQTRRVAVVGVIDVTFPLPFCNKKKTHLPYLCVSDHVPDIKSL